MGIKLIPNWLTSLKLSCILSHSQYLLCSSWRETVFLLYRQLLQSICVQRTVTSPPAGLCSCLPVLSRQRLAQLTGCPTPALQAHTENVGSLALCISSHSHIAARLATVLLKFILILVTNLHMKESQKKENLKVYTLYNSTNASFFFATTWKTEAAK